jgi:RNA polymerase sigma-70 factor, ECF subfamily
MREAVTEDAILQIYGDTIDPLYATVSRRCGGDRALAEDITQETWLRAVRAWRVDGLPERPLAWLRTVARNLLLNRLRERAPIPLDAVPPERIMLAVETDAVTESAEIAAVIHRALARLPRPQARLLESFHFDRRPVSQIAAATGVSTRAVEGRLRRARQKLRRELESLFHSHGELI